MLEIQHVIPGIHVINKLIITPCHFDMELDQKMDKCKELLIWSFPLTKAGVPCVTSGNSGPVLDILLETGQVLAGALTYTF